MREYVVNRPNEAAMNRILTQAGPEGVILRLAWQAGLSRDEIAALTWNQVSFLDDRLELSDRHIPLVPALRNALLKLHEIHYEDSPHVVLSSRAKTPMAPESISRIARQALDREGQTSVRLMDLRHDWILRQLQDKDWATVSRISGVEIPTLQARFASYVPEKRPSRPEERSSVDEFKLWRVLQAERSTPAGLALWLTWQLGLQAQEIVSLTWSQVDFEHDVLCLAGREVPLTNAVRRILEETRRRNGTSDPHVLLTEHSRKPMDLPRLSRLTRAALIRGGMEHVLLRDLRKDEAREDESARILTLAQQEGALSRGDVMDLLGISKTAAYTRLHRLTEEKKLVRIGGKYYLPGTVVPPEQQLETVQAFLERSVFAYRQDVVSLLRIQPKQCSLLLRHWVDEGHLVQSGQKYFLPQQETRKVN